MNNSHQNYDLPIDSEEAKRLLYGIVDFGNDGEAWYDYDGTPPPPPIRPLAMPTAELPNPPTPKTP